MKTLETLSKEQIESQATSDARMKLQTTIFKKLDKSDLLENANRFVVLLHHMRKNGYNEEAAMREFQRDAKELLEKTTKQNQLNIIEAQQIWKENAKQAWESFKRTIAPYYGDDMINWTHKFHDEVSKAKTEPIEDYVKERILEAITSDFISMKETDFKRKLLKQFESREFFITIEREPFMSKEDAYDLRQKSERQSNRAILWFRRGVVLKPRIRR